MRKSLDKIIPNLGISIFALFFPLGTFLQSAGMGILLVSLIFVISKRKSNTQNKNLFLFSFPFLLYLCYWLFAYDKMEAANFLLRFSPIAIVPVFLIKARECLDLKLFKKLYVIGTLLAIVYCMLSAFQSSGEEFVETDKFLYYNFASYLSFHPTYFALIVISSLVLINADKLFASSIFTIACSILFVITLLLLQIRSAIFIFLVLCVFKIVLLYTKKRKIASLILICLVSIGVLALVGEQRFSVIYEQDLNDKLGTHQDNGVTQRIWLWKTALVKLRERPIFGHGLRTQRAFFHKQVHKSLLANNITYRERASKLLNAQKNLHNQYLQWLYDFGFFGLMCLLSYFLFLFLRAQKNENYVFMILLVIFMGMMITENLMDRQTGIYFFASVLPIIYLKNK